MWRRVLNLPDTPPPAEEDEPAPAPVGPAGGWHVEDEDSRRRWVRVLGRGLLWGAVVLFVLLGVRSLFVQPKVGVQQEQGETFPVAAAQAAAGRFASSYLTHSGDGEQREQRRSELAPLVAPGVDVGEWAGSGTSRVGQVLPGAVTVSSSATATVSVTALVTSTPASAGKENPDQEPPVPTRQWVSLSVPVVAQGARVGVSGPPAFVAAPSPPQRPREADSVPDDSAVTASTREAAVAFFKAYAGDDRAALIQAAAPGAQLEPLGGQIALVGLDAWHVPEGDAQTRIARATVTWDVAGSSIQQNYRLTLTATSAGQARSWRVQRVDADQ